MNDRSIETRSLKLERDGIKGIDILPQLLSSVEYPISLQSNLDNIYFVYLATVDSVVLYH